MFPTKHGGEKNPNNSQLFTEVEVIVMDISRLGKYPSLSPTLTWIIVLVYNTQAE